MLKFDALQKQVFLHYIQVLNVVLKHRPDIPPTRDEILMETTYNKQDLKNLERLGILKGENMLLKENHDGGSRVHGRVCYSLTELGAQMVMDLGAKLNKPVEKVLPPVTTQEGVPNV